MGGQKNRSGGKRPGSGPYRRRLYLSGEQAKSLALLTKHRRAALDKPELTEEDVVSGLVEREWQEVQRGYEPPAEVAQEPYII